MLLIFRTYTHSTAIMPLKKSALQLAREEGSRAVEQRTEARVAALPISQKRKSTSPSRTKVATRRRLSSPVARSRSHKIDEANDMVEAGSGVDARLKVREQSSRDRTSLKRGSPGPAVGASDDQDGDHWSLRLREDGDSSGQSSRPSGAKKQRHEQEHEPLDAPSPPPSVSLRRRERRYKSGKSDSDREPAWEDFVDDRFYNEPSVSRASAGSGIDLDDRFNLPNPSPLVPSPAKAENTPSQRFSWDAGTACPSLPWRAEAWRRPQSGTKRVAFKDEVDSEEGTHQALSPGNSPPSSPTGKRAGRGREPDALTEGRASLGGSPSRGILKQGPRSRGASGQSRPSGRMSFLSLWRWRERGRGFSAHRISDPKQERPGRHSVEGSSLTSVWARLLSVGESLLAGARGLAILLLAVTLLVFWAASLLAVVRVGFRIWSRSECPPGQVRAGLFGLWGDCVVSQATVKKLVAAVRIRTAKDLCEDPWGATFAATGAGKGGPGKGPSLQSPPRYRTQDVWGSLGLHAYPWADLTVWGVEREWAGRDLQEDVRVHLRGRREVLRALWRQGALLCRGRYFLAENWQLLLASSLLSLLLAWAYVSGRSRLVRRKQVERIKRVIVDLLIAEGELPPEHARLELLDNLNGEFRHLETSRSTVKTLWPAVVRAVEKDSRVTKAPRERHGRAIPHWVWLGKRLSRRMRHGAMGAAGLDVTGQVPGLPRARGQTVDDREAAAAVLI